MPSFIDQTARRFGAALLLAAFALPGCATVPDLGQAPELASAGDYAATAAFTARTADWPADAWWRTYGDPQLDSLMEEALAGSPTLAAAGARLRRAEAFVEQGAGLLAPQVGAEGEAVSARQSYNNGIPRQIVPQGWNDAGRATLNASWNLDLFGRNRALLAAARSEAEAARADAAQARLVLTTEVASAYADLDRLHADHDAARDALRLRTESEDLIRRRLAQGLETRAALERAVAGRAIAEAELAALEEALGLGRNRLAALLGQGPDRGLSITRPAPATVRGFGLPENLPASLIGRRPDIIAAKLAAEAARRRIDAARADFYPDVNLVALIGTQALGLDLLGESASTVGSVGPAISLPIFTGGRLEGAYRGRRAEYDAAVAAYDQTLTQALREVADVAVSSRALEGRLARSRDALAASQSAHELARARYAAGLGTYLDVITAEDALVANRRAVTALEARGFALDVALIRALGGGYRA